MIRIVDGKEVIIICLNDVCLYYDNTCIYFCRKYFSTTAMIHCPESLFEPWYVEPVKP